MRPTPLSMPPGPSLGSAPVHAGVTQGGATPAARAGVVDVETEVVDRPAYRPGASTLGEIVLADDQRDLEVAGRGLRPRPAATACASSHFGAASRGCASSKGASIRL